MRMCLSVRFRPSSKYVYLFRLNVYVCTVNANLQTDVRKTCPKRPKLSVQLPLAMSIRDVYAQNFSSRCEYTSSCCTITVNGNTWYACLALLTSFLHCLSPCLCICLCARCPCVDSVEFICGEIASLRRRGCSIVRLLQQKRRMLCI